MPQSGIPGAPWISTPALRGRLARVGGRAKPDSPPVLCPDSASKTGPPTSRPQGR